MKTINKSFMNELGEYLRIEAPHLEHITCEMESYIQNYPSICEESTIGYLARQENIIIKLAELLSQSLGISIKYALFAIQEVNIEDYIEINDISEMQEAVKVTKKFLELSNNSIVLEDFSALITMSYMRAFFKDKMEDIAQIVGYDSVMSMLEDFRTKIESQKLDEHIHDLNELYPNCWQYNLVENENKDIEEIITNILDEHSFSFSLEQKNQCIEHILTYKQNYPAYNETQSYEEYDQDRKMDFKEALTQHFGWYFNDPFEESIQELILVLYQHAF